MNFGAKLLRPQLALPPQLRSGILSQLRDVYLSSSSSSSFNISYFAESQMAQSYQYRSLSSPRAIRVLELLPAASLHRKLHCGLVETSVDDPLPFDALSYVWGYPQGDKPLICGGQTILITENCELALRYLRRKDRKVLLWVDAVCIDQYSVLERNHQVSVMGSIYHKAKNVIIWLGCGSEDLQKTFTQYQNGQTCE